VTTATFSAWGIGVASAFVIYVLFAYPLILAFLARRRSRVIRRAPYRPPVSMVIAVHNGAEFLTEKLESILALDYPRDQLDILVVSDGSTDDTDEIAKSYSTEGVRLLQLPRGGKPAAINAGIKATSGEILVLTDVRQVLAPGSLGYLLENFADPAVGAASAELVIRKGDTAEQEKTGLYWRYELWIRLKLSALDSIFGATGAYYAIRRSLVVPIPERALLDDMHLPLAGFLQGYRLIVDVRAQMFDLPSRLETEFDRKRRTLAGNYQILQSYPQLLNPSKNRLWWHFVSYKFGRLLLPFALLLILVLSFGLRSPWKGIFIAAQGLFYLTAILDKWLPEGPAKKLTTPVRTFVTLMVAALLAPAILFTPDINLWTPSGISRNGSPLGGPIAPADDRRAP
jgi:cellulose synthase/poly-beta-1,6-N-acetylglucosamine synthase-like glycosyltransferase